MKRLFALLGLALGLALAQAPAYPENTLGLGYAPDRGFYLQGSALLPFSPFAARLRPPACLGLAGGALSVGLGLGYQAGAGLHLAWGAGFRLYLEPLALEVSASDRYPFLLSLLYLW